MDYLKVYNHFYQKAFTISRRMVMAEMKKAKAKKRPFTSIHNKISKELYDYYKVNYTDRLSSKFKGAYNIFQNRYEFYDGTVQEVISFVLDDEVMVDFTSQNPLDDYRGFIIDLAVESSLKEVQRHFSNYRDFYELIYDLNKYEYFYFKDFEGITYRGSDEYQVMKDIKYPSRIEERKEPLKCIDSENTMDIHEKKPLKKSTLDNDSTTLDEFEVFTDDEKFLIINILITNKNLDIGMVEYMKLIRIAGSYEDVSIFNSSPTNSTSYAKVNKGLGYSNSVDNKKKLLKGIIDKLTSLKLKSIIPTLKLMLLKCK
jgi:hypothetical protein